MIFGGDLVPVALGGVAGAVAGAALPTPAYRLSVEWRKPPRSSCRACDGPLPAGVPGWLALGSACSACGARNGPLAWPYAAVLALACAGLAWRFGASPELVPFLALVPLGGLLAAVDIACRRLPETLVLPAAGASLLAFAVVALCTGAWGNWVRALLGGLALAAGYLVLALLPGGQLGGGDVMLAGLLGIYLGWLGWPIVVAGAVLPFLVNAPVAIILLIMRRTGWRSELPFGPAMLVGAYLAVVGLPALVALLAP